MMRYDATEIMSGVTEVICYGSGGGRGAGALMSPAVLSGFALFLIGAALFLAQLWAQPWSPETFLKLMVTDGVLLAIVIVGGFVLRERRATERCTSARGLIERAAIVGDSLSPHGSVDAGCCNNRRAGRGLG